MPRAGQAEAATSFGTDYHQLVSTSGSTNTSTTISIASAADYVVDPFTSGSTLTGTPSGSTPSGYGWRTAGVAGTSLPAGTWNFKVTTQSTALATVAGDAHVRVYVYSADTLGSSMSLIGTDDAAENVLPLSVLGSTVESSLSFSASAVDLTRNVLVVEYWIIVDSVPLLTTPTVTFQAASTATTVELPTSPAATTYYLGTPTLHSVGLSESLSPTESAARLYQALRPTTETIQVLEGISFHGTRPAADTLAASESISFLITRTVTETLAISDELSAKVTRRTLSDSLGVSEEISPSSGRPVSELTVVTDAVAMSVTRSLQDSVSASDALQRAYSSSRNAADAVSTSDSAGRQAMSSRAVSEGATIGEGLASTSLLARSVADSISAADSSGRQYAISFLLTDALTLADSFIPQPRPADQLSVADSLSIALPRNINDSIAVQALAGRTPGSLSSDSIQVADQITGVAVSWSRSFAESLAFEDCTPFSCNEALHLEEAVALADAFSPPPGPEEALAINDSISVAMPRGAGDALAVASAAGTIVRPLPQSPPAGSPLSALGALIVSDAALVDPLPSEPVSGQYSMPGGDPAQLVDQLGLPTLGIGDVSDLQSMAVMLPTYHVNLNPSDELPGDDALMTVRVAEVPAETEIIVPVDIASTPDAAEHDNIPSITLEFTSAVNASNFALVLSIIDSPPGSAPEPEGDLIPLYLDVRWVGTFGGAEDPGTAGFYSDPPEFTFAISEEWADENSVERDGNGVPLIALRLFDESTGEWEKIDDIDAPASAADEQYTYVAHLEHFSTYALAAAVDEGGSGRDRHSGARLSVQLADSLSIAEEKNGTHFVVEEPASLQFAVQLLDSVSIGSSPVVYWPLQAGENVSVLVTVIDIRPAGMFPPAASALVATDITNTGAEAESFVLEFWHGDSRSSIAVEVGPGESRRALAEVQFTAPGRQSLGAETRTTEGDLIAFRQISIDVPWLAVHLHLVAVLLGVLAVAAGTGLYAFARSRFV